MTTFKATNSITRRYLKRGELMAKRRAEAQSAPHSGAVLIAVDKAVNGTLSLRSKREESGSVCLEQVAIFAAGHRTSRKEGSVTAQ